VADHLETHESRGVKLLPQHPVGDDVLVVVGHHREAGDEKIRTRVAVSQGGEAAGEVRIGNGQGVDAHASIQYFKAMTLDILFRKQERHAFGAPMSTQRLTR
jgi:hypothetical protein